MRDPDTHEPESRTPGAATNPSSDTAADSGRSGDELPERPLGLSLLTWLLAFWAGAILLILLTLAFGEGPVMMSGRSVRRPEALALLVPVLGPMALAAAGAALALALRQSWARAAVFLPVGLVAMAPVFTGVAGTAGDLTRSVVETLPFAALLAWYLYGRATVVKYFGALRAQKNRS